MDFKKNNEIINYLNKIDKRLVSSLNLQQYIINVVNYLNEENIMNYDVVLNLLENLVKKHVDLNQILDASKDFLKSFEDTNNLISYLENYVNALSKNSILIYPGHLLSYLEKAIYFIKVLSNQRAVKDIQNMNPLEKIIFLNYRLPIANCNPKEVMDMAFNLYESPSIVSFLKLLNKVVLTKFVNLFNYRSIYEGELYFKNLASKFIFYLYYEGVKSDHPLFKELEKPLDKNFIDEILNDMCKSNYSDLSNKLSILSLQLKSFIVPPIYSKKNLNILYFVLSFLKQNNNSQSCNDVPKGLYI